MDGIGSISKGFGLAADSMGVKPNQNIDPHKTFSGLLNKTIAEQSAKASPSVVSRYTYIDRESELYEQCQALETFLVKNILNAMRKNVLKSSLIDTGYAGEIYEDMLWDEYAKDYTKNAGFGLADLAYLELTGQRGRRI